MYNYFYHNLGKQKRQLVCGETDGGSVLRNLDARWRENLEVFIFQH